jgi:hypothetical protein
MKKIFLIAGFMFAQFSFAQEEKTISTEEKKCEVPKLDLYVGVGGVFYNDFNLNQKISASGMPEIRESMPEFIVGINTLWEKYSFDAELSSSYSTKKNSTTENKLASGTFRLRGHYNFVNKPRVLLSGGLNVAYTHNDLNLYSRDNDINLNDLNPENNSGHVSLKNDIFYAGPSLAFNLKRKEKLSIRLNVGYEFAFTNGKWKSDYANVSNTVKENGQNRLMVGVVFF